MSDTAQLGREVSISIGALTILGIQTKGLSVNNEQVDVSDENSNGWKETLNIAGDKSVEFSFSGIVKNLTLLQSILTTGSQMHDCTITYKDGSTVTGEFFLGSYSDTGEYNGSYTFDAALSSSEAITFTPGG